MYSARKEEGASRKKVGEISQPPGGRWGWMIVFSSFMIHVLCDGLLFTFGIFYVGFLEEFKEGRGITSLVASTMAGTNFLIGPVAGWLIERYGCRASSIGGSLGSTFGLAISSVASNVTWLIFTAGILTGAGLGLMILSSVVCVSIYFGKKRALATGITTSGSGFGTFAMAPFIQWLLDLMGWRSALLLSSGIMLNCCVFGSFLRPLNTEQRKGKPSELDANLKTFGKDPGHLQQSLWKNQSLIVLTCSDFCIGFGMYAPLFYLEDRIFVNHIASKAEASYLMSILGISNIFGKIIYGYLLDSVWINKHWMYCIDLTLCGLMTSLSFLCTSYTLVGLYAAVFGFTSGGCVGSGYVITADIVGPDKLATAFGIMSALEGTACLIGIPIVGWIYDYCGSYDPGFVLSGIVITLGGLLVLFIPCIQDLQKPSCVPEKPTTKLDSPSFKTSVTHM